MKNEWIDIKTAAKLEGKSQRTIERRLAKYGSQNVKTIQGRGGKDGQKTLIHLSALSAEAQRKFHGSPQPESTPEVSPDHHSERPALAASEYWISARAAGELEGVSQRTITRRCVSGEYQRVEQDALGAWRVHVHALSPQARLRFYAERNQPAPVALKTEAVQKLDDIPAADRERAFERLGHVHAFQSFAARHGGGKIQAAHAYCITEQGLTPSTLLEYVRIFDREGLRGLIPKHHHKGREAQELAPEIKRTLYKHYLESPLPNKALSARVIITKARREGWECPGERTLIRRLDDIPADLLVKHQFGQKAFLNSIPSMLRSYNFAPMHCWVSDHHQFNVAVVAPGGAVVFPWLTGWMDMKSRKLVGWDFVLQPNADTVCYTLYKGVKQFGSPEHGLIDNGKDYKCYRLTGLHVKTRRFAVLAEQEEVQLRGAFQALGMTPHFAIPYNAKSKPIERMFKTYEESFCCQLPGWRGRNILERPEALAQQIKKGELLALEEFAGIVNRWIPEIYHQKEHRGRGMKGRSPEQVWQEERIQAGGVPEENLRLLLLKLKGERTVQKNGIEVFGEWYRLEPAQQLVWKDKKVWVRYDPADLTKMLCYDQSNDTYIGEAKAATLAGFVDEDALVAHKKQEKIYKEAIAEYYKQQEIHLAASLGLEERVGLSPEAPKTPVAPAAHGTDAKVVRMVPRVQGPEKEPAKAGTTNGTTSGGTRLYVLDGKKAAPEKASRFGDSDELIALGEFRSDRADTSDLSDIDDDLLAFLPVRKADKDVDDLDDFLSILR